MPFFLLFLIRKRLSSGQMWFLRPYFPLIRGIFVFRSGLRFSFWALEVPELRVRKGSFSLTKIKWKCWCDKDEIQKIKLENAMYISITNTNFLLCTFYIDWAVPRVQLKQFWQPQAWPPPPSRPSWDVEKPNKCTHLNSNKARRSKAGDGLVMITMAMMIYILWCCLFQTWNLSRPSRPAVV